MSGEYISDATFEREMYNLHLSLGDLCTYGQWHKADPTKPLTEMIQYMTQLREEYEEAATKRAIDDWAWEAEEMRRLEEAQARVPCAHCDTVQRYEVCDVCHTTLARYDALSCASCSASYRDYRTDSPCVKCHPRYIEDYRHAEERQVAKALVSLASGPGPEEYAAIQGLMTLASGPGPEEYAAIQGLMTLANN